MSLLDVFTNVVLLEIAKKSHFPNFLFDEEE